MGRTIRVDTILSEPLLCLDLRNYAMKQTHSVEDQNLPCRSKSPPLPTASYVERLTTKIQRALVHFDKVTHRAQDTKFQTSKKTKINLLITQPRLAKRVTNR